MLIYIIYMYIVFYLFLFILGACLGSFLCCQARRLHLRTLKKTIDNNRSVCLHCHAQLKWYDNLPVISWLLLKGKCRYCKKKIGLAEILSELSLGLAFLLLGTMVDLASISVLEQCTFVSVFVLVVILAFLAIYDGLYGELPSAFLYIAIVLAVITTILDIIVSVTTTGFSLYIIIQPLLSTIIFSGIYFFLYKASKGKWVGNGDYLLCLPLGLVLGEPILVFVALFIANFLACVIMFPIVKKTKNHKIYFGPFLVIAFVITLSIARFLAPIFHF